MPAPEPSSALPHLDETAAATSRYLEALTVLTDEDMRAPSLLPGWSRGHVVTHVARNADGLRNLLVWARTGVETPQYPSWEQRNRDIDSGADRPHATLLADSRASAERFLDEVANVTGEQWEVPVRTLSSDRFFPARDVLKSRRTEVEVHHADLGAGYSPADWSEDFVRIADRPGAGRPGGRPLDGSLLDRHRRPVEVRARSGPRDHRPGGRAGLVVDRPRRRCRTRVLRR